MALPKLSTEQFNNASPEELSDIAAECLSRLSPGRLDFKLFKEVSRLIRLSTFELTPLKISQDGPKVLLAQRPETDEWWPGQWHLPGGVQLPEEATGTSNYTDAATELLNREFGGKISLRDGISVFDAQLRSGPRGSEQAVIGWAVVEGTPASGDGEFFNISSVLDSPPQGGLVEGHATTIRKALAHYCLEKA